MTVKSSANSVILILFAISDNLSAENSKLSADSWNRGNHLFGCMVSTSSHRNVRRLFVSIIPSHCIGWHSCRLLSEENFHHTSHMIFIKLGKYLETLNVCNLGAILFTYSHICLDVPFFFRSDDHDRRSLEPRSQVFRQVQVSTCLLYLSFVFVFCICLLYLLFVFVQVQARTSRLSFALVCWQYQKCKSVELGDLPCENKCGINPSMFHLEWRSPEPKSEILSIWNYSIPVINSLNLSNLCGSPRYTAVV